MTLDAEVTSGKCRSMGIGKLADPSLVFVRQFRFIINSEHLDESYNFSVHIDWIKKIITLDAYEVVVDGKIPIHDWANAMEQCQHPTESLNLVTFDGCGSELYRYKFSDLTIRGRESYFSYEKSDVSIHKVVISFNHATKPPINSTPSLAPNNYSEDKPQTAEVNFLNGKMFVR